MSTIYIPERWNINVMNNIDLISEVLWKQRGEAREKIKKVQFTNVYVWDAQKLQKITESNNCRQILVQNLVKIYFESKREQ